MSVKNAENEIKRFLTSPDPEVICITGKWGCGKTYAWNTYLKENQQSLAMEDYAYVSLFGITSLDGLKEAIFENTINKNKIGKVADFEDYKERLSAMLSWRNGVSLLKLFSPVRSSLPVFISTTFLTVRNQIICIDDYERKGTSLSGKDVLGLVSFLKEQRSCKIALILNEDSLDLEEKEELNTHLEKVVDIKITFSPTADEASSLVFRKTRNENDKIIASKCLLLEITNIRIINKIRRMAEKLQPLLRRYDAKVTEQALHSLVLLGLCVYDKNAPVNLDLLKKRNYYRSFFKKDEKLTPEQEAADALLDRYKWGLMDDFDYVLLDGIKDGYFDSSRIETTASKLDAEIKKGISNQKIAKAWELFHNSFEINEEDVVITIFDATVKNMGVVSLATLSATASLFRDLGKTDLIPKIIQAFVNENKDKPEAFDLMNSPFRGEVQDPDVRQAIEAEMGKLSELPQSPMDLLSRLASKRGWSEKEISAAAKIPEDDYFRVFKEARGDALRSILSFCMTFRESSSDQQDHRTIYTKAYNTLVRIGGESQLNARRVKNKAGITIPDVTGTGTRVNNR